MSTPVINNLKNILLQSGVSQAELAAVSGVSTVSINNYFNEKTTPSAPTVNKIRVGLYKITSRKYAAKEIFPDLNYDPPDPW